MATRSLTKIYDHASDELICTMYCHFDGYPSGVGAKIKEHLQGVTVVNGISPNTPTPYLNRMGKVAAALCSSGNDYEFMPNDCKIWVDYIYNLHFSDGKLLLVLQSYGAELYRGLLDDFEPNADFNEEE